MNRSLITVLLGLLMLVGMIGVLAAELGEGPRMKVQEIILVPPVRADRASCVWQLPLVKGRINVLVGHARFYCYVHPSPVFSEEPGLEDAERIPVPPLTVMDWEDLVDFMMPALVRWPKVEVRFCMLPEARLGTLADMLDLLRYGGAQRYAFQRPLRAEVCAIRSSQLLRQ